MNDFFWLNINKQSYDTLSDAEKYQTLVNWSCGARGKNPIVFDETIEWLLDDSHWTEERLTENKKFFMEDLIGRFKSQNAQIRKQLEALKPSGLVNEVVFEQLDKFDWALSGNADDKQLSEIVSSVFADFNRMKDPAVRTKMAGSKTGAAGTDSIEFFSYINFLENCDAGVQWALFMPQVVKSQQNGFKVVSFAYKKLPAMRFIGKECVEHDENDMQYETQIMQTFDALHAYKTEFSFDILFQHHYGKGVDVSPWRGFWGRFMKADTPVPEGFVYFDFIPQRQETDCVSGLPYLSQFAYAIFKGDTAAMHRTEGFDSDAMYDVTRNIILGQGVNIPYPDKYWTAEVFLDGVERPSSAYMFSVEL
ncbi:MAG: hypothetical protein HFE77_01255 [Clostridiales bacterium]|nr:hypothetical protein [Clostridiales bacterium]